MFGRRSSRAMIAGALSFAFTLAPALGHGQPAKPPASDPAMAHATERFFNGQKLYGDGKFEEALVEFRASYAAAPSPNNRLYIARCLRQLGRAAAAYDEYAQVIVDAADRATSDTKYAATTKAAAEERAALKGRVATLTVSMPREVPGVSMHIGSEEIPPGRWRQDLTVDVGRVVVRAEAPGYKPFEKDLTLAGGEKQQVVVELSAADAQAPTQEAPKPGQPSASMIRPVAYATAGVGVAGFALFGIFGLKAASRFDDLSRTCPGRCDPEHQADVDAGRRDTAISNIGLAVGVLGVAGGVTLFVVDLAMNKPPSTSPASTGSIDMRVSPDPTAPSVLLQGRF